MRTHPSASEGRGGSRPAGPTTLRVGVGDVLLEAAGPDDFVDEALRPAVGRVHALVGRHDFDPGLIPRATMVRANDGAPRSPLRTFSGRLAHENGLVHSRKSGRMLGWEGATQYDMIVKAQTMHDVVHVAAESVRFEYVDGGVARRYTADLEFVGPDGQIRLIEVKRDERDLADPDLCRTLAIVAELCRCCAISFEIVFARDVFVSRRHRAQAAEFASRSLVRVDGADRLALKRHAEATGGRSTLGEVRSALCPEDPRHGTALMQAMTVARAIEMDLTRRLHSDTPVVLYPGNLAH